jgi:putative transposase
VTGDATWRPRRLGVGDTVIVDGQPGRIAGIDAAHAPDMITIVGRGGAIRVSPAELVFDPRITLPDAGEPTTPPGEKLVPSMRTFAALVGAAAVERALELAGHLTEVETGFKDRCQLHVLAPDPRYDPAVVAAQGDRDRAKVAELAGTALEMKIDTLRKLRAVFRRSGYDPCCLIAGYRLRRRSQSEVRAVMVALMRADVALRISKSKVTRQVVATTAWLELRRQPGFAQVSRPSLPSMYRWISDDPVLDAWFANTAKTNRSNALKPDGAYQFFSARATRPGQAVQIDTWEVPIRVLGPDGAPMNVRLVLAIDIFSRSALAWRFVPMADKAVDVSLLLAHMVTPEPMRPDWEPTAMFRYMNLPIEPLCSLDERLAWASQKPVILPETIFIDNGKPYDNLALRLACERLGISIQPSRFRHPTDKAIVENTFKAIQTLWAQVFAGYKGGHILDRGADVDLDAFFTLEQLEEMFTEWVIVAWQSRTHRGLDGIPDFPGDDVSPNDMYALGVATNGFIHYPLSTGTYLDLLPVHICTISDKEVTIETRRYRGPILVALGDTKSPYGQWAGKWPVAQDPQNITRAYLKDPATGEWHVLKWQYADVYGTPMSDYRWRTARTVAALRNGGRKPLDGVEVVTAAIQIRDKMLAVGALSAGEISRDAALDGERIRMAVAIAEHLDGTVDTGKNASDADSSDVIDDIWDAEPIAYPDLDAGADLPQESRI